VQAAAYGRNEDNNSAVIDNKSVAKPLKSGITTDARSLDAQHECVLGAAMLVMAWAERRDHHQPSALSRDICADTSISIVIPPKSAINNIRWWSSHITLSLQIRVSVPTGAW
jgi:hypothetical protein